MAVFLLSDIRSFSLLGFYTRYCLINSSCFFRRILLNFKRLFDIRSIFINADSESFHPKVLESRTVLNFLRTFQCPFYFLFQLCSGTYDKDYTMRSLFSLLSFVSIVGLGLRSQLREKFSMVESEHKTSLLSLCCPTERVFICQKRSHAVLTFSFIVDGR